MKILYNIGRWLIRHNDGMEVCASSTLRSDSESLSHENVQNIHIFSAVGGRLVEFRRYDRKNDTNHVSRYIIDENADFGEKLSKLCTLEFLKS